jgi:hypothetical protein
MKSVLLWASLIASLSVSTATPPFEQDNSREISPEDADQGTSSEAAGPGYTTFDGIKVPPMKDIDGEKFSETVQNGYW